MIYHKVWNEIKKIDNKTQSTIYEGWFLFYFIPVYIRTVKRDVA